MSDKKLTIDEIGNTYVNADSRFIVSLVVGYSDMDNVQTLEDALLHAIDLTRDGGSWDTHWYVHDRQTGITHQLEQKEGEPDYRSEHECEECCAYIPDTENPVGNTRHTDSCSLHPDNITEA